MGKIRLDDVPVEQQMREILEDLAAACRWNRAPYWVRATQENPVEALRQVGGPARSYDTGIVNDRTGERITPARIRVHSLSEINPYI